MTDDNTPSENRGSWSRRAILAGVATAPVGLSSPGWAQSKNKIAFQPYFASVKRAMAALSTVGQPLDIRDAEKLEALMSRGDDEAVVDADAILSKYVLANVVLATDGYSKTTPGAAPKRLIEQGWTAFLVRVENPSGITGTLNVSGQHAKTTSFSTRASRAGLPDTINPAPAIAETWYRNELYPSPPVETWYRTDLYQSPPLGAVLSGANV